MLHMQGCLPNPTFDQLAKVKPAPKDMMTMDRPCTLLLMRLAHARNISLIAFDDTTSLPSSSNTSAHR